MPAKSRRKRGKNIPPSKRTKRSGGNISGTTTSQPPENTVESAAVVKTQVIPEKKPTSQDQVKVVRYPYISTELRTIGIFAVLVLVILGILAAIL